MAILHRVSMMQVGHPPTPTHALARIAEREPDVGPQNAI